MLKALNIKRFKSIRSQRLEFGRVNIIIGGNGSGKSNVLEAIGLLSASLGRSLNDAELLERGIRLSPPELMKAAHKNTDLPKTLELEGEFVGNVNYKCNLTSKENDSSLKFHSESCFYQGEPQFGRGPRGTRVIGNAIQNKLEKNRGMWDQAKIAYPFPDSLFQVLDEFSKYKIYSPQTDFLRGSRFSDTSFDPIGLHGEGLPQAVKETIAQAHGFFNIESDEELEDDERCELQKLTRDSLNLAFLPHWATSVEVGRIKENLVSKVLADKNTDLVYFIDRYMNERRNTLSAYDSSEGTLFLLFLAVLLSHKNSPKIFSLDNVDNALNPFLTKKLLESIIDITGATNKQNLRFGPRQVFLTSHNPTSLDAFDLFDDDLKVFVAQRDNRGHTRLDQLQPRQDMTREEWARMANGRNLSQLWLDGEITGANGEIENL